MKKVDTFKITVDQLVEALGGIDNIKSAYNCATRFRAVVNDESKVNKDLLKNVEKSKGFSKEGDQWQIIFGAGIVNKVYSKYEQMFLKNNSVSQTNFPDEKKRTKWNHNYSTKTNIFLISRDAIRNFADIFIPLIPLFIAGGLSLAINSLISVIGKTNGEFSTYAAKIFSKLFDTVGGAILGSLPVFIGYTSAKKWGGSGWLGAAIGLILIAPGLVNSYSLNAEVFRWYDFSGGALNNEQLENIYTQNLYPNLWKNGQFQADKIAQIPVLWAGSPRIFDINYPIFGIPLMGYQAQVIPTLLVIAIAVQIEKLMKKISHESIAILSVPLVSVIFSTILAFVIVGPIGYMLSLAIAEALRAIFVYTNFPGFGIGGAILGAIYAPIVVTGLHQGFLPIETQLLTQYGESWITPIACVSNVSQAFACLGASIYLKDKSKKTVAYSGSLSANLGITEPAMFGVNINLKHIFLSGIIGSAVGGYWLGMTQTTANSLGSASWIGLIQFDVTTQAKDLIKWYDNVANATPWGKYMNGFGIPPIGNAAIAMTMSCIVSFIFANILSWNKSGRENLKEYNSDNYFPKFIEPLIKKLELNKKETISYIYAPIDGELFLPGNMGDAVFDGEMMGKSFAIKSSSETYDLYAPFNGKIENIFDTGHAITISNKKGNSLLIHIGLETAKLNTDSSNLKNLKFFKFKKFILSNVKTKGHEIVSVENNKLIENGAKDNKVFFSLLNESIKENQKIEVVAKEGLIKKGDPILKIATC